MVSDIAPVLTLMLALLNGISASDDESSEKIIIHVPYKIHSHLHTHTNYKIIKVPENSIEKLEEPNTNEEEMKYLNKEIETILSGKKLSNVIKNSETHFQPQTYPVLNLGQSSVPIKAYQEFKEVEHFHPGQEEPASQNIISLPTKAPTIASNYQTTLPDNKYSEGKLYYHAFSTKPVPFYNPPIGKPTYQVVEEKKESHEKVPYHMMAQETHERVPHRIVSHDSLERMPHHISHESQEKVPHQIVVREKFIQSEPLTKAGKDSFFREYIQKPTFSSRPGKISTTTKSIKLPMTTKLYSLPTKSTKTFVIPTKSLIVGGTKKPKSVIKKNNEEYEHIGYLVVGENSQQFVTVSPNKN